MIQRIALLVTIIGQTLSSGYLAWCNFTDSGYCSGLAWVCSKEKKFLAEPGKDILFPPSSQSLRFTELQERGDCKYRGSRVCNGAIVKTFR